jgi:ferric-dicitrate binding protein FerR (iron transport regulator)
MEKLGRALMDEIGDGAEHRDLSRQRAGFAAQLSQKRTTAWVPLAFAGAVAGTALIMGFWVWRAPTVAFEVDGQVGHEGQEVVALADEVPIIFADASVLHVQPGSRLRVEKVAPGQVRVRLTAGALAAHVRHATPMKWDFLANGLDVHVVGTRLSIALTDGIEVSVLNGAVRVSGQGLPAGGVAVEQGERIWASAEGRYVVEKIGAEGR